MHRGLTPGVIAFADQLRAAGIPDSDIKIMPHEGIPGDQTLTLIARWRADKPTKKPMLILGHMDVVEAKREDWKFDPFEFREEGGYFYGRGALDNKAGMVAITTALLRLRAEGFKPARDLIVFFTGDEETAQVGELVKQLQADGTPLVLEQEPERFDELHLHVLGQPADVVVGLDVGGPGAAAGLDHVGVERALHQEADLVAVLDRLAEHLDLGGLEGADELPADDLALLLRVGDVVQCGQEPVGGVHGVQVDPGRGHEVPLHLLALDVRVDAEHAGAAILMPVSVLVHADDDGAQLLDGLDRQPEAVPELEPALWHQARRAAWRGRGTRAGVPSG